MKKETLIEEEKKMKTLKTLLIAMLVLSLSTGPGYAASNGKGKGADKGKAKGRVEQPKKENKGKAKGRVERPQPSNTQVTRPASTPVRRSQVNKPQAQPRVNQASITRPARQVSSPERGNQNRGANHSPAKTNQSANIGAGKATERSTTKARQPERENRGRSAEHFRRKEGRTDVVGGLFNALAKARWSHNPHDQRGQGNMGKPNMRDPYGFDKDSGREKAEHARPFDKGSNKGKGTHPKDTDNDGIGNNADTDDDNDGVLDSEDAFPYDAAESKDSDKDGIGDNADLDDDNDGVLDTEDAFPLDSTESIDSDKDGIGNNADSDDDNDGILDSEDALPFNPAESKDSDKDGIGDNADLDDDNDGILDTEDALPFNPDESSDFDKDGIGDNADLDDDNDGILDTEDALPFDPAETKDTDKDGVGDNADLDDDNDGVLDSEDAFPLDSTESKDSDKDGIGDNTDLDDDNDGVLDTEDAFPYDAAETKDTDKDGIGDNADLDDDNDGVLDTEDLFPLDPAKYTLPLEDILDIDFTITDYTLLYHLRQIELLLAHAQQFPQDSADYQYWYDRHLAYKNDIETNYTDEPFDRISFNTAQTIDYALTFSPPEGFEGTTLLVTTALTNVTDYDNTGGRWVYDSSTGWQWTILTTHYDAGQVVAEQTQEVVLEPDNTFSVSYDPPDMGGSYFFSDLAVTVTEPVSGQSYTVNYDRQIFLYFRCPYGKVTDKKTGQPIVGAKVTVHFEDGSIVPLDKAANSTASNPQRTDATGRYGFKLQTGRKYYLTASAPGYKDYKSEVFTEKWHVLREDVALAPSEEKLALK